MTKKTKPMQEDQTSAEVTQAEVTQETQADGQGDLTPEVEVSQEAVTEPVSIDESSDKSEIDLLIERVEKLEAQIKRLNSHVL